MTGTVGPPGLAGEWNGGRITNFAHCVLAPNAGPMTLDGTNTWIVGAPGSKTVVLIDPGPSSDAHWQQVAAVLARTEKRVEKVLLTHGHLVHSAGAELFARKTGAPVLALDPQHRLGDEGLVDGDVLDAGGTEIRIIGTPGHTSDSLTFHLVDDQSILTGDTVLGRGTTVVAYPDGRLSSYLDSLNKLAEVVAAADLTAILPGHGPVLEEPAAVLKAYLAHRESRLAQVREAMSGLADETLSDEDLAQRIVEIVYVDVPRSVWPAAWLSVRAQVEFLRG